MRWRLPAAARRGSARRGLPAHGSSGGSSGGSGGPPARATCIYAAVWRPAPPAAVTVGHTQRRGAGGGRPPAAAASSVFPSLPFPGCHAEEPASNLSRSAGAAPRRQAVAALLFSRQASFRSFHLQRTHAWVLYTEIWAKLLAFNSAATDCNAGSDQRSPARKCGRGPIPSPSSLPSFPSLLTLKAAPGPSRSPLSAVTPNNLSTGGQPW